MVAPREAFALDVPPLQAHVNDTADLLSVPERAQLEQQLTDYEHQTGRQFALLTIASLAGDALESFSIRVVESWKLGQKGKDSGLLLLIVKDDHKLRIEVGYGLEGTITDAFSARLIRTVLVPSMRAGQAAVGIGEAFQQLQRQASGEDVPGQTPVANDEGDGARGGSNWSGLLVLLLFGAPILIPLLIAARGGRGGRGGGGWGGGGFGGGGFGGGGWGGGGGFGGGGFGGGGGGGGGGFSGGGGGFGGGGGSGSW